MSTTNKPAVPPAVSEYMREIGKRGSAGRIKALSPEERTKIAKLGGKARGRAQQAKARQLREKETR